jgi:hypothetical protein
MSKQTTPVRHERIIEIRGVKVHAFEEAEKEVLKRDFGIEKWKQKLKNTSKKSW